MLFSAISPATSRVRVSGPSREIKTVRICFGCCAGGFFIEIDTIYCEEGYELVTPERTMHFWGSFDHHAVNITDEALSGMESAACAIHLAFLKFGANFFRVPLIRTIVCWGLYLRPPSSGNCHMLRA